MLSNGRLRTILKLAALALVAIGLVALAAHFVRSFRVSYRVAYSTADHGGGKLLQTIGQATADERTWLAFQRTPLPSLADAASALQDGQADLALIRPDVARPDKGSLIGVLRRDAVFLIAPAKSPVESFKDLKGRTVAVLSTLPADEALLDAVLDHYSVARATVRRVRIQPAGLEAAVRQKTIDAVFMVSAAGDAASTQAFAALSKAGKAPADIVGVDDAEGLAKRLPNVGTVEIDQGVFAGSSPRPEEAVTTLAVAYQLMASRKMSTMAAAEVARLLLVAKTRMAASKTAMDTIETPDTDDSSLDLHPGAKAFYDGEAPSFLDRAESLFWIGSALLSLIASGFAWILAKVVRRDEDANAATLETLVAFLEQIRVADASNLEQMREKLDDFVASMVRERSAGTIEPEDFNSLSIGANYTRQAIADRAERLRAESRSELEPAA